MGQQSFVSTACFHEICLEELDLGVNESAKWPLDTSSDMASVYAVFRCGHQWHPSLLQACTWNADSDWFSFQHHKVVPQIQKL